MFKDLFEYEDLQEAGPEFFAFSGVTFKRDFGPWKKGQRIDGFGIKLEGEFTAEEYKEDTEEVVKSCKCSMIAIA